MTDRTAIGSLIPGDHVVIQDSPRTDTYAEVRCWLMRETARAMSPDVRNRLERSPWERSP